MGHQNEAVQRGRHPFLEHGNPYTYTRTQRLPRHAEQVLVFEYVYVYEHDSAQGTFLNGV